MMPLGGKQVKGPKDRAHRRLRASG